MNRDQFKAKLMAAVGPDDYEKVFRAVREQMRSLDKRDDSQFSFTPRPKANRWPRLARGAITPGAQPEMSVDLRRSAWRRRSRHGHLLDGCARRVLSAVVRCHNSVGAPGPCRLTHALG